MRYDYASPPPGKFTSSHCAEFIIVLFYFLVFVLLDFLLDTKHFTSLIMPFTLNSNPQHSVLCCFLLHHCQDRRQLILFQFLSSPIPLLLVITCLCFLPFPFFLPLSMILVTLCSFPSHALSWSLIPPPQQSIQSSIAITLSTFGSLQMSILKCSH